MLRLNRVAARVALEHGAACDGRHRLSVLLGHAGEMVEASRAGLVLEASRLPVLPGCARWPRRASGAAACSATGAGWTTRSADGCRSIERVPGWLASLVTESETSGRAAVLDRADRAAGVLDAFRRSGEECWEIGSAIADR